MPEVAVLKCSSYNSEVFQVVKNALDSVKADRLLKDGIKVLIKPNILGPECPSKAVTTHPLIIDAVCKYLKNFNVRVFIGESSGSAASKGTEEAFKKSRIAEIAEKHNIEFINFDNDKKVIKENKEALILKKIPISKKLSEMDLIINACKLKTHMLTGYTGAVKNMFGILPGRSKVSAHALGRDIKKFSNIILDVYTSLVPQISIMDAVVGMEGNGPRSGKAKQTGLILASKNAVALDVTASKIIGFKPEQLMFLKLAKKRNLFPEEISIIGEKGIRIPYKKPLTYCLGFLSYFTNTFMRSMQVSFEADKKKCKACGCCMRACPQNAIIFKNKTPVWDKKKCIMCYCCHEMCPHKAVILKKSLIARIADKFTKRFND
jgi:uncharacterized protein (DUF362 family)